MAPAPTAQSVLVFTVVTVWRDSVLAPCVEVHTDRDEAVASVERNRARRSVESSTMDWHRVTV